MEIKSAFVNNGEIPIRYTCLGPNISPPLTIIDVPNEAKSLVLIFEDMDAVPKPWKHWHLFNIPPDITRIEEGTIPLGATEGLSNNHTFGYEGPCPRYFSGTHHYRLRLYALDGCLDLPAESESEQVLEAMEEHILDIAELVGICTAPITQ